MPTPLEPPAHPVLQKQLPDGRTWRDIVAWITNGYWLDANGWIRGGVANPQPVLPEAGPVDQGGQPVIHPRSVILHSNAGPRKTAWASIVKYWRRKDVTGEPHFQVHGVDAGSNLAAASLVQAMPLNRRADCNAKANSWWRHRPNGTPVRVGAISFETEDRGYPTLDTTPWSIAQLHAMIGAITVICVVYGVACSDVPTWDGTGIGFHSRFPEWSIYKGKTCPGAARIRQMDSIRAAVAENLAKFSHETDWHCGQGAA